MHPPLRQSLRWVDEAGGVGTENIMLTKRVGNLSTDCLGALSFISVMKRLARILSWPSRKMRMRREMAILSAMSDYELHDIGLTRGQILNMAVTSSRRRRT